MCISDDIWNETRRGDDVDINDSGKQSKCLMFAQTIHDEIVPRCITNDEDNTDSDNAHYCPDITNHILRKSKTFPLWSCVCRDTFNYGRVPATSSCSESMFNNIRNRYFGNMTFPIRVDDFIVKHTDIIDGKMHMSGIDTTPTMSSQQSPTDVNSPRSFCKEPLHRDSSVTCKICTSSFAATIPEDEPLDKHLCQLCLRMSKEEIENILASRTYENWYGLVAKEEKKKIAVEKKRKVETQSLYLQPNFTENQLLLHQSLKRFPVLKNGNSCTAPVPVDGKATVLSNTCAFDSIAQVIYTRIIAKFPIKTINMIILLLYCYAIVTFYFRSSRLHVLTMPILWSAAKNQN